MLRGRTERRKCGALPTPHGPRGPADPGRFTRWIDQSWQCVMVAAASGWVLDLVRAPVLRRLRSLAGSVVTATGTDRDR